jgi:putative membrane protein
MLPLFFILFPPLFSAAKSYIYLFLVGIVGIMILTEKGKKKLIAVLLFFMASIIGLLASEIPINSVLLFFPIFAGFFGVSQLLLGIRNKIKIPKQKTADLNISRKTITKSGFLGSLAGSASGFLPGVGTSEIASLATVDKNDKSFLITLGAITTANTVLSILALWLIEKSRSGLAVAIDQLFNVGFTEILLILFVTLVAGGIAVVLSLFLARKFVKIIGKINYIQVSIFVCISLFSLTVIFTGFYGVLLLAICTSLGIFTNLVGIKRSILMGVLILPTILFYLG